MCNLRIISLSEVIVMSYEDKNSKAEKENENNDNFEEIKETASLTLKKGKHNIFCLTIIGEIEGHTVLPEQSKTTKYEHIIPQLVGAEENDSVDGVLILLNTVGGDVEAGLAIAELISGMKTPTVSFVLGGGHSIGVPLAVAARRSFIAPSATMTVHPVRMNGLVIGVPQMLNHFQRMQDRISTFVCNNSNVGKERFNALLMNTGEMVTDMGTVLDGEAAVKEGIIDSIGTLSDVLDALYKMIEEN